MQTRIEEIQSFIAHQDYQLAIRRILDISLDSRDTTLLQNAVNWSTTYSVYNKDALLNKQVNDGFLTTAKALLQQAENLTQGLQYAPETLLIATDISKRYNKGNFSLKPISLQVVSGNISGIVGENGNGKTTLLRCLAGQLATDTGTMQFSQLPNADHYSIKNHVAFIPQRIPQWYGLLKDNLHFSAALSGVVGEENELMVNFMLERLNLSKYANLTWNQISSGYRTRFEIARVLLQKPKLLILDEPLANLDINAQQTMLTDLRYLAKSSHNPLGILLSSQQLHEVEKIADVVYFIKEGKCIFKTNETATTSTNYVMELETTTDRDSLLSLFAEGAIQMHYNGNYYTLTSSTIPVKDIVGKLLQNDVPVTYFRDITYSTKRFF